MRRNFLSALMIASALVVFTTAASAQTPVGNGAQFQVNTYGTSDQDFTSVAVQPNGDFVVVWESPGEYMMDTSGGSIQAQRYASDGTALGNQVQVNTYTTNTQSRPDVAVDSEGDFVVVWESFEADNGDSDFASIQGQLFASDGSTVNAQFLVNTYTSGSQLSPSVAMQPGGAFVVAWDTPKSDVKPSSTSVVAQRFNSDGTTNGDLIQVNSYVTQRQQIPSVAIWSNGDFVIAWESFGSAGDDSSSYSIQAQRFTSDGMANGGEFQVNTYTQGSQRGVSVAVNETGEFVIVWSSYGSSGTDTSTSSVQAQRYNSDGTANGAEFQVNTYTSGYQKDPAVALEADGEFYIVWASAESDNGDDSSSSIQGKRYGSDGGQIGQEFLVNTYTTNDQSKPAIAHAIDGEFIVTWQSNGSGAGDNNGLSAQGQQMQLSATVGDRVWLDSDLDGIQDMGEDGVAGVRVNIYEDGGPMIAFTDTDAMGNFSFADQTGDVYLEFELPMDSAFTQPDVGADDSVDSDAAEGNGQTITFTVIPGVLNDTWDAGLATGIGDRAWYDTDADGIQEGHEPGLANVTVELFTDGDVLTDTTTTDSDGNYGFGAPTPGNYYVRFTLPAGLEFSLTGQTDDANDSDADPMTGNTEVFAFTAGELVRTWDAGMRTPPFFADDFEGGDTTSWTETIGGTR